MYNIALSIQYLCNIYFPVKWT